MSENSPEALELISFAICPFVQRSVIALNEKNVDYKLSLIDLANPPTWFKDISPMGKVPVLKVGATPIFESAVISEYLDEVYPPSLHPQNVLEKARHRAWIEFASGLIGEQFRMLTAADEAAFTECRDKLKAGLQRVEQALDENGPFFSGDKLALIDTAFAPIFVRLALVNEKFPLALFSDDSKLGRWSQALRALPSVQHSVAEDFEQRFMKFFTNKGGFVFQSIAA